MEAASRAERTSLLPTVDEEFALGSTAGAEDRGAPWTARAASGVMGARPWAWRGVATFATTLCLTLGALFVAMNTSGWHGSGSDALALQQLGGVSVTLEVEPVGHVIWLGSKLPNVKRVFPHLNQELLQSGVEAQALVRIFSLRTRAIFSRVVPRAGGVRRRPCGLGPRPPHCRLGNTSPPGGVSGGESFFFNSLLTCNALTPSIETGEASDITQQNFPYTYSTIRRALRFHDESGENVFSMIGDLMKFEILYHFGGLYMDTNIHSQE